MKYTVLRGEEIGNVVINGRVIRQYDYICENHEKGILMQHETVKEDQGVILAAYCPECKLSIMESIYEDDTRN